MAKYRHLSRTMALQTLTALLLRAEEPEEKLVEKCFAYVKEEFAPELQEKDDFARALVKGVLSEREELDRKIGAYAPEWPIEKLSAVERVILELGIFELASAPETPLPVVINEWIEVAKEFGDETAGKFVNGVLSSVGRMIRPEEKESVKSS